jgi:hypothetical protein
MIMNHQLKFGYSQLGYNILVKLNCKLSSADAVSLEKEYPEICIMQSRNGYRIEGCFNTKKDNFYCYKKFEDFKLTLALKLNDYKINKLIDKSQSLLNQANFELNIANLDEL